VDAKLDIDAQEADLRATLISLEFPPEGIVTVEWADAVQAGLDGYDDFIAAWDAVEAPPVFATHYPLMAESLSAGHTLAEAMRSWIGVGANPAARQARVDAYTGALERLNGATDAASNEFDAAFDELSASTPPDLLTGPVETPTGFESDGIESVVTQIEETRWQFSWKAEVFNRTPQTTTFAVRVRWLDADDFPVSEDIEIAQTLRPGERRLFTGLEWVNLPAAATIESVEALLTPTHVSP
jgi:hypothetical protein